MITLLHNAPRHLQIDHGIYAFTVILDQPGQYIFPLPDAQGVGDVDADKTALQSFHVLLLPEGTPSVNGYDFIHTIPEHKTTIQNGDRGIGGRYIFAIKINKFRHC
jgi:hypothetical protein